MRPGKVHALPGLFVLGKPMGDTRFQGLDVRGAKQRNVKVARVPLVASDAAGGLFAWQNKDRKAVIVERVILDIATPSTGACTADVGQTATSATTLSDNLIDGASLATAAKVLDNLNDAGTNGKSKQKVASDKWVTGSVASGASAGLVGYAYIHYFTV